MFVIACSYNNISGDRAWLAVLLSFNYFLVYFEQTLGSYSYSAFLLPDCVHLRIRRYLSGLMQSVAWTQKLIDHSPARSAVFDLRELDKVR